MRYEVDDGTNNDLRVAWKLQEHSEGSMDLVALNPVTRMWHPVLRFKANKVTKAIRLSSKTRGELGIIGDCWEDCPTDGRHPMKFEAM